MILTGPEIRKQIDLGEIVIKPFVESHLGPNSYDLRLDKHLAYYSFADHRELDMKRDNEVVRLEIPENGYVLCPGVLYLGTTIEYTETKSFAPMIDGRSSVGRLGIGTHVTAGRGDVNFHGRWTLELTVIHPVRVYAGVRICQIYYHCVQGELQAYAGKYQNQTGPQPSRLWRDFVKDG